MSETPWREPSGAVGLQFPPDTAPAYGREAVGAPPGAKQMRRAYGFDEVAIVPWDATVNPELTDIGFDLAGHHFDLPILAAAMDAVVNPTFAAACCGRYN